MYAERLRIFLKLYQPQSTADKYGSRVKGFSLYATIRAERAKTGGVVGEEAGEMFAAYTAEYNVRDAHPVKAGWRLEDDGELYDITAVHPNATRGMLTLTCTRVNQ